MGNFELKNENLGIVISFKLVLSVAFSVFLYSFFSRNITLDYLFIIVISMLIIWNSITYLKRIKYAFSNHDYYNDCCEGWRNSGQFNPILIIFVYGLYITDVTYLYYFGLFFVTTTLIIQLLYYYILDKNWVWPWLICSFIILTNLWSFRLGTKHNGIFERQQYVTPVNLRVLNDSVLKSFYIKNLKLNDSLVKSFTGVQLQKLEGAEMRSFLIESNLLDSSKPKENTTNNKTAEFEYLLRDHINLRSKIKSLFDKKAMNAECSVLIQNEDIFPLTYYLLDPFFFGLFTREYSHNHVKNTFLTLKILGTGETYQLDTSFNALNFKQDHDEAFIRLKTIEGFDYVGVYGSIKSKN